jgi:hypothetical protein
MEVLIGKDVGDNRFVLLVGARSPGIREQVRDDLVHPRLRW